MYVGLIERLMEVEGGQGAPQTETEKTAANVKAAPALTCLQTILAPSIHSDPFAKVFQDFLRSSMCRSAR
jgi:hypothetical protein